MRGRFRCHGPPSDAAPDIDPQWEIARSVAFCQSRNASERVILPCRSLSGRICRTGQTDAAIAPRGRFAPSTEGGWYRRSPGMTARMFRPNICVLPGL